MHAGQVDLGRATFRFRDLKRTAPLLDCLIEGLFLLFFGHDPILVEARGVGLQSAGIPLVAVQA